MASLEGLRENYSFRVTARDDLLPSIESEPSDGLFIMFTVFQIVTNVFPEEDWYYCSTVRKVTEERFVVVPDMIFGNDSSTVCSYMFNHVKVPPDYHDSLKHQIEDMTRDVAGTTVRSRFCILVEVKVTGLRPISNYDDHDSDAVIVRIPRLSREDSFDEARDVLVASKSSVEELERVSVEEICIDDRMCSICLDEFEAQSEVIRMPCLHMYHGTCIVRWLEKSNLCPLCRFEMPVDKNLA